MHDLAMDALGAGYVHGASATGKRGIVTINPVNNNESWYRQYTQELGMSYIERKHWKRLILRNLLDTKRRARAEYRLATSVSEGL